MTLQNNRQILNSPWNIRKTNEKAELDLIKANTSCAIQRCTKAGKKKLTNDKEHDFLHLKKKKQQRLNGRRVSS